MRGEQSQAPDAYQATYMGDALYHDKLRAPLVFHLLFIFALVAACGGAIAAGIGAGPAAALPAGLGALVLVVAWLLFSVLRISVTKDEVYVQYGLFGPRIAVRDIERCAAVDYDWKRYGGWGIRVGLDGTTAYNMVGDQGRAVEIAYSKGAKTKKVLVASPDPERLAAAINRARTPALGGAGGRVRIAATVDDEVEAESVAEEEAAAGIEKKTRLG
jgi:hypothetical protein